MSIENTMADATAIPTLEKKPFPADRAMKLALAREKALEVRRKNKQIRLQKELDTMKERNALRPEPVVEAGAPEDGNAIRTDALRPEDVPDEPTPEEGNALRPEPTPEPEPEPPEPPKAAPIKKKRSKKQMVVVEQSSDDSDDFEPNQNVVFVKRVRKKQEKAPDPPPVIEHQSPDPSPVIRQPQQPQRPELTPEQQQIASYYNTMFTGNFMNTGRRR